MKTLYLAVASLFLVVIADSSASVCFRFRRAAPIVCRPPFELTPEVAKQALMNLLRTNPIREKGGITSEIRGLMCNAPLEHKGNGKFHWTGICTFDLTKNRFTLFMPWSDRLREFARPDFNELYVLVAVFEGSFEYQCGRWIATNPEYKHTLLD